MKYQVYKIKNSLGCVIYIGITKESKGYLTRFKEHKSAALSSGGEGRTKLHRVMFKGGVDNFTVHLMFHNIDSDKAGYYEQLWISKYNTYYKSSDFGCNMTKGGHGCTGYEFTDDVKVKMSNGSKLYWERVKSDPVKYERVCKLRSENLKGKTKSFEHRRKLSVAASKKTGEKNSFYGKHHTEETKAIITKVNGLPVLMLDVNTEEILQEFPSALQAGWYVVSLGKTTNKTPNGRILDACHGVAKTAYGFKWKFKKCNDHPDRE